MCSSGSVIPILLYMVLVTLFCLMFSLIIFQFLKDSISALCYTQMNKFILLGGHQLHPLTIIQLQRKKYKQISDLNLPVIQHYYAPYLNDQIRNINSVVFRKVVKEYCMVRNTGNCAFMSGSQIFQGTMQQQNKIYFLW